MRLCAGIIAVKADSPLKRRDIAPCQALPVAGFWYHCEL